jgi:hypothetical protein
VTRASIVTATAVLLAGCPLPQPLPDYPPGSVTPPRILMDVLAPRDTVIRVPADCATAPSWNLTAALVDTNTGETVTARWFVDYERRNSARCRVVASEDIPGPGDQAADPTHRAVAPFRFTPYDFPPVVGSGADPRAAGVVHVVELVVSNRFDPAADEGALCTPDVPESMFPFRTAASDGTVQFETQTYRWVFVTEQGVACP